MEDTLPAHWIRRLEQYVLEKTGGKYRRLSAIDFPNALRLSFPDGSVVHFRFAFHLLDAERDEIAVFTEHCGYHVFPASGVEVSALGNQA